LPYAPHVVAKIHAEPLDYDKIFAMLARHRYRGFLTLEYEGTREERHGVPQALAMLRRTGRRHGF
jgi:sugar phosphate isomerase/epimerase